MARKRLTERERLERAAAIADDLPDDELADAAHELEELADFYLKMRDRFRGAVLRRMTATQAAILITPNWIIEKEAAQSYKWDVAALNTTVRPMVPPAMWDGLVEVIPPKPAEPTIKVNTQGMKSLAAKLGPEKGALVMGCARIEETNPRPRFRPAKTAEDVTL